MVRKAKLKYLLLYDGNTSKLIGIFNNENSIIEFETDYYSFFESDSLPEINNFIEKNTIMKLLEEDLSEFKNSKPEKYAYTIIDNEKVYITEIEYLEKVKKNKEIKAK